MLFPEKRGRDPLSSKDDHPTHKNHTNLGVGLANPVLRGEFHLLDEAISTHTAHVLFIDVSIPPTQLKNNFFLAEIWEFIDILNTNLNISKLVLDNIKVLYIIFPVRAK